MFHKRRTLFHKYRYKLINPVTITQIIGNQKSLRFYEIQGISNTTLIIVAFSPIL